MHWSFANRAVPTSCSHDKTSCSIQVLAPVHISTQIVSPPFLCNKSVSEQAKRGYAAHFGSTHREVSGLTTAARHCKGENKDDQGTTTSNGGCDNEVPLGEQHRFVTTEVALSKEAKQEVGQKRRVDANGQPAEPGADDEGVEVVELEFWEELVSWTLDKLVSTPQRSLKWWLTDPKWNWDKDSKEQSHGYHPVHAMSSAVVRGVSKKFRYVHDTSRLDSQDLIGCTTPSHRLRIVGLHVLTRPNVGTLDGQQDLTTVIHDTVHHDPVEH